MNIFVSNLASEVSVDDLRTAFADFGVSVIDAVIMEDAITGESLGYAHVYIVPEHAGRKAVATLDGAVLRGKAITVRQCIYRERRERRATGKTKPWTGEERRRSPERRNVGPFAHEDPGAYGRTVENG